MCPPEQAVIDYKTNFPRMLDPFRDSTYVQHNWYTENWFNHFWNGGIVERRNGGGQNETE